VLSKTIKVERAANGVSHAGVLARVAAVAAAGIVSAALGASAFAPGMQMKVSPAPAQTQNGEPALAEGETATAGSVHEDGAEASLAAASATASAAASAPTATPQTQVAEATAATPEVPITELDLALVKRQHEEQQRKQVEQAQMLSNVPQPYVIGPGDVLQIIVWDHPELAAAVGTNLAQSSTRPGDPSSGFVVDQTGDLSFPYAGTLHVAGLRAEEVQKRLAAQLGKYFVKPQVTVRMASYRAHEVYVDGEFHTPGVVAVNDVPMSLYEAIARAGGFSDTADQSDLVLVRDGTTYRVNLTRMLANGISPSRLYLRPGDLLRAVARDENDVYVMGEVNKPISAIPRRTGRITLADALAQAGSVNASTADAAQMFVIRGALNGTPEVFHLDGRSPVAMLVAKEFDLQPKDVVYVDGNGLVRFNRVLTLLLPMINAGLTAGVAAK
jgi:polysaccharide biosynthesis/export protein